MKRLIYFLTIMILVFPVVLITTPLLVIGLVCETVGDMVDDYLHWVDRLVDKF